MDDQRKQVLEAIVGTGAAHHGELGGICGAAHHVELGGMRGRALGARIDDVRGGAGARTYTLSAGGGELVLTMGSRGGDMFEQGALRLLARSRRAGSAFVEQLALLFESPLAPAEVPADAPRPVFGAYTKLGSSELDGARWEAYKLTIGDDAELFLRVSAATRRAAFVEKWDRFREPLLGRLERELGSGREIAPRRSVETGGVRFSVPPDWVVTPQDGHVRVTDAADRVLFEVSQQPYPLHARLPGLVQRLTILLASDGHAEAVHRIAHHDRGDVEHAWVEYEYDSDDARGTRSRTARGRLSLMANETLHSLATFSYWPEDAHWAVPEWDRMVATMQLATRARPW